jgi:ATP-dependent Lon protease
VSKHYLLPVLPLRDSCLFPEASLTTLVSAPAVARAVETAQRTGGLLLAVQSRDQGRELQPVGTVAQLREQLTIDNGTLRVELDGSERARVLSVIGVETQVAEVETLTDGDEGDDWGPAVEALARYLHAHPDLRSFLDQQRRSGGPMSWVNLACQHLPITASARQKLLESSAAERCRKIALGLDALLRKEKGD